MEREIPLENKLGMDLTESDMRQIDPEKLLEFYNSVQTGTKRSIELRDTFKTPSNQELGQQEVEQHFTQLGIMRKVLEEKGIKIQSMEEKGL